MVGRSILRSHLLLRSLTKSDAQFKVSHGSCLQSLLIPVRVKPTTRTWHMASMHQIGSFHFLNIIAEQWGLDMHKFKPKDSHKVTVK